MTAIGNYFSDLWLGIVTTVKGLTLTGRYFVSPKVTMQYPEVRPQIPASHRGVHLYIEEKCSVCMACAAACPVDCIMIEDMGRGKDAFLTKFDIDYSKCLFCNLCCEACKSSCLFMGEEYDLSAAERAGCVLHFARTKNAQEIEAQKVKLQQKEAERKAKQEAAKQEAAKQEVLRKQSEAAPDAKTSEQAPKKKSE